MPEVERHAYDVRVLGAGGVGLHAVIEARQRGMRVASVCKSRFGKAHTVMAEGGCGAAMGNVNGTRQVHFRTGAGSLSTTGASWSCTPRRPRSGCGNREAGVPCSTVRRTGGSASAPSAATPTRGCRTGATAHITRKELAGHDGGG